MLFRSDVEMVAENMQIRLTDDEILKVMEIIVKRHDADIGINWDVIGSAINYVMDCLNKEKSNEENHHV